ncbi:MAG: pilus assembly protein PilB, partial [Nitrospirota bacterium]
MLRSLTRTSLAEILVDQGMLTTRTVEDVLRRFKGVPAALGQMLISEGLLSEDQLAQAVAVQYSLPYDPLKDFQVDSRYYETISVKLMQRFPFIPIAERDGVLTIAIADPQNVLRLDELELLIGKPLELIVSPKSAILSALDRSAGSRQALRELEVEYRSVLVKEDDRDGEILTLDHAGEEQSPAVKLLDS